MGRRLCSAVVRDRLQTFGLTAREAIDPLRVAVWQRSKLYKETNAAAPLPETASEPLPPETELAGISDRPYLLSLK